MRTVVLPLRRLFFDRFQLPESCEDVKILDEVPGLLLLLLLLVVVLLLLLLLLLLSLWLLLLLLLLHAPALLVLFDQEVMGLKRLEWLVWRPTPNSK